MAKFGVGDTVIGNALNCHGVTCEDCIVTVTSVGKTAFSGIIDEHPSDGDYEGETHNNLKYEWFDLEESASDLMEDAMPAHRPVARAAPAPSKRFSEMAYITVGRGPHKEYIVGFREGDRARILQYEEHKNGSWLVTLLFNDGETAEAYEYELMTYSEPAKKASPITFRDEELPKDVKVWGRTKEVLIVAPAHKPAPPVKQAALYERLKTTGVELVSKRRRRSSHIEMQPEYDLEA